MQMPPLNELLAFQKVGSRLSFKKASDEMNLTPSTLSHLIRSLEDRLQTRLLNRTTRSVALTATGQKLFTELGTVLENLQQVLEGVDGPVGAVTGHVRISTNETAAPFLLERLNRAFYQNHPGIQVDLIVDNHFVDIVAEGFDAGVRLRDAVPKDMIAVPLIEDFRFITVASPAYLRENGRPRSPEDLAGHNCIGFQFQSGRRYEWEFAKAGRRMTVDVKGSLSSNNPRLMVDAAKAGIGIACVAESLVRTEIAAKELVVVLAGWEREWPELCLYYPKNRHMPAAFRTIVEALSTRKKLRA